MDDGAAIRVALLGMDTRKAGLLRVYIHMMSKRRCEVGTAHDADVVVIDFDAPDALDTLADVHRARPHVAVLGLSYGNAVPAGLQRLEKPVHGPELLAALYSLSAANKTPVPQVEPAAAHNAFAAARRAAAAQFRDDATSATAPVPTAASAPKPVPVAATPRSPSIEALHAPIADRASTAPAAPVTSESRVTDTRGAQTALAERYGDKFHIRGVMVSADSNESFKVKAGPVRFVREMLALAQRNKQSYEASINALPGALIRFHPAREGLVGTTMPDGTLRSLCVSSHSLTADQVQVRECAPFDPLHALPRVITGKELVWKLTLWRGRGRRLDVIADDTPVALKHWPNLTRVLPIDHAVPICALLIAHPHSMADTARILAVDIRFIHAICGAAYAVGLLDIRAKRAPADGATPAPPAQGAMAQHERAGLFGRIIQHIFR